ncbi:MAG: hypothetical protein R3A10_09010 [Caldilineaceae bacterium]
MTSADARLTFSPHASSSPTPTGTAFQAVTVAVADNAALEGLDRDHAARHAQRHPAFDGLTGPTVNVLVIDNDTGGVRITPTELAASEDGGDASTRSS